MNRFAHVAHVLAALRQTGFRIDNAADVVHRVRPRWAAVPPSCLPCFGTGYLFEFGCGITVCPACDGHAVEGRAPVHYMGPIRSVRRWWERAR